MKRVRPRKRTKSKKCRFIYRGNPEGIASRARQKHHVDESRKRKEREDHVDEWREQERCGFTYTKHPMAIIRRSRKRSEWEGKYENHPKVLPHQTDDPRARFKDDKGNYRRDGSVERHILHLFVDCGWTQSRIMKETRLPSYWVQNTLRKYKSLDTMRAQLKEWDDDIETGCGYRKDLEGEIASLEDEIGSPGRRITKPSYLRLVVDNSPRKPAVKVVSSPPGDDVA